jgi:hypothetical protein
LSTYCEESRNILRNSGGLITGIFICILISVFIWKGKYFIIPNFVKFIRWKIALWTKLMLVLYDNHVNHGVWQACNWKLPSHNHGTHLELAITYINLLPGMHWYVRKCIYINIYIYIVFFIYSVYVFWYIIYHTYI